MSNPLLTYPGIVARNTRNVHLCVRSNPMVLGYQVWGARSVNAAYGDPLDSGVGGAGCTELFQVARDQVFRSPSLRSSGRGQVFGNTKGHTHMALDPTDFSDVLPPDNQWMYLRLQERRAAGLLDFEGNPANPVLGPIFCVPDVSFFGRRDPTFTLQATAPSSTNSSAGGSPDLHEDLGDPSPRAMHLVFSGWLSEVSIRNISEVGLLVSFGPGQTMRLLEPGDHMALTSSESSTKEILLACPDGVAGANFTLHAAQRMEM